MTINTEILIGVPCAIQIHSPHPPEAKGPP